MIDRVPHFTSPSTLGDPQQVILIVLITLMGLAAAFGIFTIVFAMRGARRRRQAKDDGPG